ncbi:MAG: hypothetical protein JWO06_515 [Bacteroidota bacterium]|nr:hypothetical protein [Bacteroidota bacterium]
MFLCLIISANGQGKATFPVQKGLVVDAENDLDLETVAQLIKLVDTHKAKAADQIAVVTVTDYAPFKTLNEYAKELSNNWKLGNNSVTFAFSQKKSDVKIYVAPGLQTKLSDVIVQKIIQEKILPKFREGNVDQALINGVMEVIRLLEAK